MAQRIPPLLPVRLTRSVCPPGKSCPKMAPTPTLASGGEVVPRATQVKPSLYLTAAWGSRGGSGGLPLTQQKAETCPISSSPPWQRQSHPSRWCPNSMPGKVRGDLIFFFRIYQKPSIFPSFALSPPAFCPQFFILQRPPVNPDTSWCLPACLVVGWVLEQGWVWCAWGGVASIPPLCLQPVSASPLGFSGQQ